MENCLNKEFKEKEPLCAFLEIKNQIENLFNITIKANFSIKRYNFIRKPEIIQTFESYHRLPRNHEDLSYYHPLTGSIIIPIGSYNVRKFIHESLHAFSNLMSFEITTLDFKNYQLPINFFIREGITEFLTGCLLFRYYPEYYKKFIFPRYLDVELGLGYKTSYETGFWFVFTFFFDIKVILKIYFDKSLNITSHQQVKEILKEEIKSNCPNFRLNDLDDFSEWQNRINKCTKNKFIKYLRDYNMLDYSIFHFL